MDQIQSALKIVTDRMAARSQREDEFQDNKTNTSRTRTDRESKSRSQRKDKKSKKEEQENEIGDEKKQVNQQNVIIFTGRALQEITRDLTM